MTQKGRRNGYVFKDEDDNEPEDVFNYIKVLRDKARIKAISIARRNMPKPQYIDENLNHYIPQTDYDDNFKTYTRFKERDTVGKIKFPWDRY
jgi:hypothetical protein